MADTHSKTEGREDWDYFVAVTEIEDAGTVPLVFAIRTIDQDVRSQIHNIATKMNSIIPRGDGTQDNPANAHPISYGDSSSSGGIIGNSNREVNTKFSLTSTVGAKMVEKVNQEYLEAVNRGDMETAENKSAPRAKFSPGTANRKQVEHGPIPCFDRKTSVISDGGLCVRITYLPRQSPAKYCQRR